MPVHVSDVERVRVLVLDRPDARNAMDTALLSELLEALHEAARTGGVRALAITGAGGSFSAGADLREPLDHDGTVRRMDLFCQVYEAVASHPRPTVAAIEGHCVGGGVEVAAACDLRVAGEGARFRFPGAALGFPVGAAKLVGLVGLGTAKDLVLTSRTVDAVEAHRIGLVQRLVPAGTAAEVATEIAATIATHPPEAVAFLRRQFSRFSGALDRIAAENDALHALAEAGGDWDALTMADPKARWRAEHG